MELALVRIEKDARDLCLPFGQHDERIRLLVGVPSEIRQKSCGYEIGQHVLYPCLDPELGTRPRALTGEQLAHDILESFGVGEIDVRRVRPAKEMDDISFL